MQWEEIKLNRKVAKITIDLIKPLIFIIFAIFVIVKVPIFFRPDNLIAVLSQAAVIGIASIGMTMVIISGEIDISIGAMIYLTGAVATEVYVSTKSLWLAVFAAIISGGICGLINGFGTAKLKIPSMIITLAVSNALTGLSGIIIGSESTLAAGERYKIISQTKIFGLTSNTWIYLALFVVFIILINKTKFGRYIYAIGDNADALRASGINTSIIQIMIFVITGMLCGISGLLATSRLGGTQFNLSLGTEIYCIAAVVVGGASMSGGKGNILGTFVGVFIVTALDNMLRLLNVSVYLYNVVWGIVIFLIVCIDIIKTKQSIKNHERTIPHLNTN